jgi:hypothetical protein
MLGCSFIGDSFLSFQRLHGAASAYGVKIYTVQAQGLTVSSMDGSMGPGLRDAQDGLKAIALETGGDGFLNGAGVAAMVSRIERDAACVYVLSFGPRTVSGGQAAHRRREGSRARRSRAHADSSRHPERIARKTATLLASFTESEAAGDELPMHGGIVPLDVDGRYFRFLVQASVPETRNGPGRDLDLGMSLVSGGDVPGEASGAHPGGPARREARARIRDGSGGRRVRDRARGLGSDARRKFASGRISGTWAGRVGPQPHRRDRHASAGDGAFLRDGQVRKTGSLVIAAGQRQAPAGRRPS